MLADIAVTLFVLFVPGALLGWVCGLRPALALASAGPLMLGVAGFSAWLAGVLGLDYSALFVAAIWAQFCAIGYLVRAYVPHATPKDDYGSGPLTAIVVAGVTVVSSVRAMIMLNDVPGGPGSIREAWDMLWHTNFLRFIDDTGVASPTEAGDLMNQETHAEMFYPTGWHAMAHFLPGSVFMDANVFAFLAPAVLLPAAVAVLARTAAGPKWAAWAGPAAAVATLALPEVWVSLWTTSSMPYLLAVAALPIAAALTMRGYIVPATIALVGLVIAHPSTAVAAALFVALWLITQPTVGHLVRTIIIGVLSLVLSLPVLLSAMNLGESVAGFTGQIEDISRGESLWKSFVGYSRYADAELFSKVILVATIIGLVVALVRFRPWTPWPALAFGLLFAVADNSQSRWAEPAGEYLKFIGTFFYDLPYRVQAILGILRAVLAGYAFAAIVVGIVAAAQFVVVKRRQAEPAPWDPAIAVGLVAAVAIVPTTWTTGPSQREAVRASFGSTYVTETDREAIAWLKQQPHAFEGHILNDRRDGSAWMYAMDGLPTLFRHFSFADDTATASKKLPPNVDLIGADKTYDNLAKTLGVSYIFSSPPVVGNDATEALAMRSWAWYSPGLTPVYQDAAVMIFAVNAMFTEEELNEVLDSSPHVPSRANPLWTPPRQPIIPAPDEAVDPVAGKHIAIESSREALAAINAELPAEQRLSEDASADIDRIVARAAEMLRQRGAIVSSTATLADGQSHAATVVVGRSPADQIANGKASGSSDSRGFSASVLVESMTASEDDPAGWQLAAGLPDGMVFRGFNPHSNYDDYGTPKQFRTGLGPAVIPRTAPRQSLAPTVALSLGSVESGKLSEDLKDPAMQEKWALAIVDGIASTLRQNPGLVGTGPGSADELAPTSTEAEPAR